MGLLELKRFSVMARAARRFVSVLPVVLCAAAPVHGYATHTVGEGDSLALIAERYLPYTASYTRGELVTQIRELNALGSGRISIGQDLVIPVIRSEPLKPGTMAKTKDFAARGIYVNQKNAGTRTVFALAGRLKASGANTVVFDAKEVNGVPAYRSAIPATVTPAAHGDHSIQEIAKLVDGLHAMGVHVAARVCVFRDRLMASSMQGWRYNGEWVDPANAEVQAYNLELIRELVGLGVDEIQLDYFRYPADGRTDTGVPGKERSDILAEYLAQIHELTSSHRVLLSLDLFGIVSWQRSADIRVLGQDVHKMMDHLDVISPMLYPSHFGKDFDGIANPADEPYYFVKEGVTRLKAIVQNRVIVRPWLQSFPLRVTTGYDAGYVRAQVDAARDAGSTGWLLWSPGNRYDEAFAALEALNAETLAVSEAAGEELPARSVQPGMETRPRERKNGGSAQESNLPRTLDAPHTGFEVRGTHQNPTASTGDT